jgi:hypothetical protein
MVSRKTPAPPAASPARQLAAFIAKFDPAHAKLIRECRAALRKRPPTATEIVYDNYNFFVIGYSATERPSDCMVSLAAAAAHRRGRRPGRPASSHARRRHDHQVRFREATAAPKIAAGIQTAPCAST